MASDMAKKMDPSQYGNQKGMSIQHYLINMIHRILTVLDNNSKGEIFAVIANYIDWNNIYIYLNPYKFNNDINIEQELKIDIRALG